MLWPLRVDLSETDWSTNFAKRFHIYVSATAPQSLFHVTFFWVLGDLMGPTLKVDSLLRLPYGCGEQNMVNFAPSIYIMKYLSSVEQLSESIENKAKNIMRTGNELDNIINYFEERCDFPFYIHDSYTGVGVQLELRAWEFNSALVTLHSSTKTLKQSK